jgi:hypothetical protein
LAGLIIVLLFIGYVSFVPTTYVQNPTQNLKKDEYQTLLKDWKLSEADKQAQELDMPKIKGATKYEVVLLQNGMKIQDYKSGKIITLKGLPSSGSAQKAFVYNDKYCFRSGPVIYQILNIEAK